jgi:hypothetical protein
MEDADEVQVNVIEIGAGRHVADLIDDMNDSTYCLPALALRYG